jgi:replicative DNA helicase
MHGLFYQKYMSREGIRISTEINGLCYDDTIDVNDIMDFVYMSFDKLNDISLQGESVSFDENVKESLEKYEERVNIKKEGLEVAYTTGLGALNKLIIGWLKTEIIILAARPSVGKTAMALYFAKACAKSGTPVDIFSLEMGRTSLTDRMILGETKIDPYYFQAGMDVDWEELETATTNISNLPITINDQMGISINYVRSIIRKRHVQKKLGLVIIDYLQLMDGIDKSTKNNEIGSITKELKILSVKYDFPLILLSQLSRESEKRNTIKHKLSDLRDSGNIEQDADKIIFMSRNRFDDDGDDLDYTVEDNRAIYLDLAKNRSGALGVVKCYCNQYINNFYEKSNIPENYYEKDESDDVPF